MSNAPPDATSPALPSADTADTTDHAGSGDARANAGAGAADRGRPGPMGLATPAPSQPKPTHGTENHPIDWKSLHRGYHDPKSKRRRR